MRDLAYFCFLLLVISFAVAGDVTDDLLSTAGVICCIAGIETVVGAASCLADLVSLATSLAQGGEREAVNDFVLLQKPGTCHEIELYQNQYIEVCTQNNEQLFVEGTSLFLHNCYKYYSEKDGKGGECCGITGGIHACVPSCSSSDYKIKLCSGKKNNKRALGMRDMLRIGAVANVGNHAYINHVISKWDDCANDADDLDPRNEHDTGSISEDCTRAIKSLTLFIADHKPTAMVRFAADGDNCSVTDDYSHSLRFTDRNCPYYNGDNGFGDSKLTVPCCVMEKGSRDCKLKKIGINEICKK